jgi:hypothetical protein
LAAAGGAVAAVLELPASSFFPHPVKANALAATAMPAKRSTCLCIVFVGDFMIPSAIRQAGNLLD